MADTTEKLSYDNVPRVCDGHERWHCDESCWIAALEAEVRRLRARTRLLEDALRVCARTDKTGYEHHEPRRFDGLPPEEVGGTIWMTPREIGRRVLGEPDLATWSDPEWVQRRRERSPQSDAKMEGQHG